jgi:hypothetical protein
VDALRPVQRYIELDGLVDRRCARIDHVHRDRQAYRWYQWPVESVAHLREAPLHVFAADRGVLSTGITAGTLSAAISSSPRIPTGFSAPTAASST